MLRGQTKIKRLSNQAVEPGQRFNSLRERSALPLQLSPALTEKLFGTFASESFLYQFI
jgi:hypothetical protein